MNDNISADTVTLYTAIAATVGVAVATAGVIVSIYAIRRDRANLKVLVRSKVTIAELINLGVGANGAFGNDGCAIIEATNVGRHPISLQHGPKYRYDGTWRECSNAWRPQSDLAEGERAVVIIGKDFDPSRMTDGVVKDVTGRAWPVKIPKG